MKVGMDVIHICSHKKCFWFYRNQVFIAVMCTASDTANMSDRWERRQILFAAEDMSGDCLILILSFPLLQIAI